MTEPLFLFPLHTVLFPGGLLPLRIFEPRYLDLVSKCLRENAGFGICLIRQGEEVGNPAEVFLVGTEVRIVDWQQEPDGLLGILVQGQRKFRLASSSARADKLLMGQVEFLPSEPTAVFPEKHLPVRQLLERILGEIGDPYAGMPRELDNPGWVASRLLEVLPLPLVCKQDYLELDDPLKRLELLAEELAARHII
jgi:Lon protease-like protein